VTTTNLYTVDGKTTPTRIFGIPLPAKPVVMGETWKAEFEVGDHGPGDDRNWFLNITCRLAGKEKQAGTVCLRIEFSFSLSSVKGMRGPMRCSGHVLLDAEKGVFVSEESTGLIVEPDEMNPKVKRVTRRSQFRTVMFPQLTPLPEDRGARRPPEAP
jgi:hypothetical protein